MYKQLILNIKTQGLRMTAWRKIYPNDTNQNKAGLAILISVRMDFKAKKLSGIKKDIT